MHAPRILHRLRDHIVVADGAMGSELLARVPGEAHLDLAALEHPREVLDIHIAYLRAGAEMLETATFAASRPRLERLHRGDLTEQVNAAAVKLAREAREISGVDALVAGSIGPLAGVVDMDDPAGASAIAVAHAEQAAILAGRGADLIVLESFFRADELELAIRAVRDAVGLPLVGLLSFPSEPRDGDSAEFAAAVEKLFALDLAAAGVNCAPGPRGALDILSAIPTVAGHLAAMPNAGTLVRRDGRILAPPATPSYLADFARRAVDLGAVLVGGCCGTGPEHIRAMADAVAGVRPLAAHRVAVATTAPTAAAPACPAPPESGLAARLAAGEFVRVVQVDPPKGTNSARIVAAARAMASHPAVAAVDINSNPLARLRMDSLWLAAEVQRETGIETIPHVTPRDASLMGLQAQLLGAWRAGLRNLLAISGDPSQLGDYPGVHDVYHVDIFELVRAVARMAEGVDCAGNRIGEPPAFHIGVAVNPCADDPAAEADRLRRKAQAGAHFAMSQVFFEWEPWLRFADLLGGEPPLPTLVGVWPLPSLNLALRLHHEVPGITVPERVLQSLADAGPDASRVGFDLAAEMLRTAPDHARGVYMIAPFKTPEAILDLLGDGGG